MAVSASNVDLMGRVCHLMNKMYRGMLRIIIHDEMTYVTLGPDGLLDDNPRVNSWAQSPRYRVILSKRLLFWITVEDRIPSSFTNFITTPELSGPLYISSDIYHAQITEYLL